jgi:hypothetical protein
MKSNRKIMNLRKIIIICFIIFGRSEAMEEDTSLPWSYAGYRAFIEAVKADDIRAIDRLIEQGFKPSETKVCYGGNGFYTSRVDGYERYSRDTASFAAFKIALEKGNFYLLRRLLERKVIYFWMLKDVSVALGLAGVGIEIFEDMLKCSDPSVALALLNAAIEKDPNMIYYGLIKVWRESLLRLQVVLRPPTNIFLATLPSDMRGAWMSGASL